MDVTISGGSSGEERRSVQRPAADQGRTLPALPERADEFQAMATRLGRDSFPVERIVPSPALLNGSQYNEMLSGIKEWASELPLRGEHRFSNIHSSTGYALWRIDPISKSNLKVSYCRQEVSLDLTLALPRKFVAANWALGPKGIEVRMRSILEGSELNPTEQGISLNMRPLGRLFDQWGGTERSFRGETAVAEANTYLEGFCRGFVAHASRSAHPQPCANQNIIRAWEHYLSNTDFPPRDNPIGWAKVNFDELSQSVPAAAANVTIPGNLNRGKGHSLCSAELREGFFKDLLSSSGTSILVRHNLPDIEHGVGDPYSVTFERGTGAAKISRGFNSSRAAFLFASGLLAGAYASAK